MSAATHIPVVEESKPELVPELAVGEFHRRIGQISRQSGVYFAGTIFTAAAGYFFKIYLARRLGAEALGLYALGMSMVGFLGLFNAVGLPTAAARFVAEYSARREFARLGGFLRRQPGLALGGQSVAGGGGLDWRGRGWRCIFIMPRRCVPTSGRLR